jgi:hypothetical protein
VAQRAGIVRLEYRVTVEIERLQGKFASKDEITEAILEEIRGANPDSIDGLGADGTSEYEITDWDVEEVS